MSMTDKPIRRKRKTPRMDVARRVPTRYQVMMDAMDAPSLSTCSTTRRSFAVVSAPQQETSEDDRPL